MPSASQPLLGPFPAKEPDQEQSQGTSFKWTAAIVATLALVGVAALRAQPSKAPRSSLQQKGSKVSSSNGLDMDMWRIQKYTINGHSGTGLDLQAIAGKVLGTAASACPSDLGCETNFRSWVNIGSCFDSNELAPYGFGLHWVDSATVNDLVTSTGTRMMDDWIEYFEDLNDDLSEFNSFMHNKVVLYASDLKVALERVEANGLTTMMRLSYDADDELVLHVGFQMAGRIFEIVGAYSDVEVEGVSLWADSECSDAHVLPDTLAYYYTHAMRPSYPTYDDMPALMAIHLSMTYHDLSPDEDISVLFSHLSEFTDAEYTTTQTTTDSGTCTMTKLVWEGMPGFAVSYVQNDAASSGSRTLEEYDKYSKDLHARYASEEALEAYSGEWYNWDHLMDQHIGFWYSGDEDSCLEGSAALRTALKSANIAVGERGESDAHEWYSGYAGPITWEYQWQSCDTDRPDAPSECACVGTNNVLDFEEATGHSTCSMKDDDSWC